MLKLRNRLAPPAARFAIGLVALLLVAAPNTSQDALAAPQVVSIAEARTRPPGTLVTVDGFVTVPSGAFKSSASDQGFAIQDRSGGIYISTAANLGLGLRRQVRVTGQLVDRFGLLVIMPTGGASGVKAHRPHGRKIAAPLISTGQISEATEGRLVQITGTIKRPIGNDLPYGYRLFINDGSGEIQAFVYASTGINLSGLEPGQRVAVTGFSGQYNDHYEIAPRFPSDIRRLP